MPNAPDSRKEEDQQPSQRDPAAPPPGGVDWRVFVGIAIALAGFALVIVVAVLG